MGFKLPLSLIRPPPPPPKPAVVPPKSAPGVTAQQGFSSQSTFESGSAGAVQAPASTSTLTQTVAKVMSGVTGLISAGADRVREAIAVSRLPPDQQKAYRESQAALAANHDTEGQAALRDLVIHHPEQLTQADANGRTTLDYLSDLAQPDAPVAVSGTSAADVLGQTVRDLDDPSGMEQGDDYLCATKAGQQYLAHSDPTAYARVMSELTLTGSTVLPNSGKSITVGEHTNVSPERSSTQQIFGQAMLGNGQDPDNRMYVTSDDGVRHPQHDLISFYEANDAPPPTARHGANVGEVAGMQTALLGGNYQPEVVPEGDPAAADAAKATLYEQAGQGKPVMVLFAPPEGADAGHWVQVTAADPEANTVTYLDKEGVEHTEDTDTFLSGSTTGTDGAPTHTRVEALTFDQSVATPGQPPAEYISWKSDDGGGFRMGGASSGSDQAPARPSGSG